MQEWTIIIARRHAERVARSPVRKPYLERLLVAAAVPAARPAPRARLLPASRIVRDVVLAGGHDGYEFKEETCCPNTYAKRYSLCIWGTAQLWGGSAKRSSAEDEDVRACPRRACDGRVGPAGVS